MDLRDIFIFTSIVASALVALRKPQVGLLIWLWISIMVPHKMAYGFTHNMPLLDGLVLCTVLGCVGQWKNRAQAEFHPILKVLLAFYVWCTLTTVFAVSQPAAYYDWIEFSKSMLLVLLILFFMNKKHWIVACFAVYILSVSFTGLKGGLFTVVGGGVGRVWGPPGGMWGSNNAVALVMVMSIPIISSSAQMFSRKLFRLAIYGTALSCFFAVLGTQSRGGLVGLLALGGVVVLRSRKKALALILVSIVSVGGYFFMPESWHKRMATIVTPSEDGSASTRLIQWKYAYDISLERPFFGNGFEAFFHQPYFNRYVRGLDTNRAVHSNIFQILGEQGFIGLALWLSLIAMAVVVSKKYSLLTKGREDLVWASALVGSIQFSVVGFAANGLTLNLAYLDLFYFLIAFTALLISHIRQELGLTQATPVKRQNSMMPLSMRR